MTNPAKDNAQEAQENTAENVQNATNTPIKPNIAQLLERLAIVKMRIVAVRAAVDNGNGLETELQEIIAQLQILKAQPTAETTLQEVVLAMTTAEECAAAIYQIRNLENMDYNDIEAAQEEIEANPTILEVIPEDARRSLLDDAGIKKLRDVLHSFTETAATTWLQADIAEMVKRTVETATETGRTLQQNFGQLFKALQEKATHAEKVITEFIKSKQFEELSIMFADLAYWLDPNSPGTSLDVFWLADFCENIDDYMPFIVAEVEQERKRRGVDRISFTEFIRDTDPETGESIKSLFEICIERAQEAKETADTAPRHKDMLTVHSIVPKSHTMPNNALINIMQSKPAINAGEFDLVVSNATKKRKEITAYTMITYTGDEETGVTITEFNLTEYERQVSDAIISLWLEATKEKLPPTFTTDAIFRAMPGGGDKPNPGQKSAITRTIERLRRIHITVDATEEMRKRGVIQPGETMRFDDFYLSATRAEYKTKNGGQTVHAYHIHAEPVILSYSKLTNQLLTVPAKCLAVEKVKKGIASGEIVKMTADRQAMTGYLLRRIAVMKRDRKNKKPCQSDIILFETLFDAVGLTGQSRDKALDNRKFCYQVLDYEAATGYIKGYEEQTQGRKVTGVKILF